MLWRSSLHFSTLALLYFITLPSYAHIVISYPGWRGNNLHTNGTVEETNGLVNGPAQNGSGTLFPYGMQWEYPCGGMPTSQNRTKWPVRGGAIAIQPGWFQGHATAFFYINMGFGEQPLNMSFNMVPPFQIVGPTRDPYPGTFCLPQVPLPANTTVQPGDLATIQIIETAVHGAALYNCVDIEFAEPSDVAEVNEENCFNSSDISFELVFSTTALSSAASPSSFSSTSSILLLTTISLMTMMMMAAGID